MSRPRAIDICAGAGGLSLGLHDAGFDVLGVEQDADAVATHRANVGPCDQADVREWHPAEPAQLVAGGVPCQTWSEAGKRAGFDDPRGMLFLELLRIARASDADVVMLENVRGMRTWGGGSALATIRRAFVEHGYAPVHRVLDAANYGVPQHRKRLFIVGFRRAEHLAAFRWPSPTHHAPGGLFGPSWVTVREALGLGRRRDDVLDEPSRTVSGGGTESGGGAEPFANGDYRARIATALDKCAPTVKASGNDGSIDRERPSRRPFAILDVAVREERERDRAGRRVDGARGWQGMRVVDVERPAWTIGGRNNTDLLPRGAEEAPAPPGACKSAGSSRHDSAGAGARPAQSSRAPREQPARRGSPQRRAARAASGLSRRLRVPRQPWIAASPGRQRRATRTRARDGACGTRSRDPRRA